MTHFYFSKKIYFLLFIPRGEMMISPCVESFSLSWIPYIIHAVFCVVPSARLAYTPTLFPLLFPKPHVYVARCQDVHNNILRVYKCLYYFDWSWQDTIDQTSSRAEDHEEGMRTPRIVGFPFFLFSFLLNVTFHCYREKKQNRDELVFNHKCLNVFRKIG